MTTVECGIHPQDVPIDEIIAGEHLAWGGKKTETNSLGNILQILRQFGIIKLSKKLVI